MPDSNSPIRIPFQLVDGFFRKMTIEARINGKPTRLLLDTGALPGLLLSKNSEFGKAASRIRNTTIVTRGKPLDITKTSQPISVSEKVESNNYVGILSQAVFGPKVIEFDFDRREIVISEKVNASKYDCGFQVHLDKHRMLVSVSSDGRMFFAMVDTGSPITILQEKFYSDWSDTWKAGGGVIQAQSMSSSFTTIPIMMKEMSFHDKRSDFEKVAINFKNVFACINTDEDVFKVGIIGMTLLHQFNFAMDLKQNMLYLKRRKVPTEKYFISGVTLGSWNTVGYVEPGSPADKAGLDALDRIVGVNGLHLRNLDMLIDTLLINNTQKKVKLTIERDSKIVFCEFANYDLFSQEYVEDADWGFRVEYKNGTFVINTPEKSSVAWAKGLRAGDIVLEIGGFSTKERPYKRFFYRMLDKTAKTLPLKVNRNGQIIDVVLEAP